MLHITHTHIRLAAAARRDWSSRRALGHQYLFNAANALAYTRASTLVCLCRKTAALTRSTHYARGLVAGKLACTRRTSDIARLDAQIRHYLARVNASSFIKRRENEIADRNDLEVWNAFCRFYVTSTCYPI